MSRRPHFPVPAARLPHRFALALLAWLAFGAPLAASFDPKLDVILPRGAERGTEVTLDFRGERLDSPEDLLFLRPGLELIRFDAMPEDADGKRLRARVRVAADAPLGEHPLRLRTSGGISYLRTIWVGAFPTVDEREPNDHFEDAQPVELGRTIHGTATREDQDYFRVALEKGQTLAVEIEAMRLGHVFFDAYVAILDPRGFELAVCDDSSLLKTDAHASIVAPEAGDYRVVVREAAYEGNNASRYRLHLGDFPRPSAVFPPGARPGDTVEFRFIESSGDDLTREITVPKDARGRFPVFAIRDGVSSPSPNWIEVSPLPSSEPAENNHRRADAAEMPTPPSAAHGIVTEASPQQWFRFHAKKGHNLEIRVLARALRSPLDSVLVLRDADLKRLEANDDLDGLDSRINWRCPEDGEYFLTVSDKLGRGGPDFTFRLEVAPRVPAISASLPVAERNNSQARKVICIPRGNRYATAVNLRRANHGADTRFEALSLPDGVRLQVPDIPRSINNFPVVFEADADAPIGGDFHRFRVSATGDQAPEVSGALEEEIHLIEINNQGAYHSIHSEQIAVAVIDKAPFSLRLAPPAAPIVPRSSLELEIEAVRDDGFEGPIQLEMIWKPPGIGAANTVTIPKGETTGRYELSATADAQPGTWDVAILGQASTAQGTVMLSTDFAPLEVAAPWLSATIDLGATEQGQDTAVTATLDLAREFSGRATAQLVGLPHGATTESREFSSDAKELVFPVAVADDAKVGKHNGLFLRIHIPDGEARVFHQCAQGGTLRIDKPRPVAKKPESKPDPEPDDPPEKPLSRLEQLRQQTQNR